MSENKSPVGLALLGTLIFASGALYWLLAPKASREADETAAHESGGYNEEDENQESAKTDESPAAPPGSTSPRKAAAPIPPVPPLGPKDANRPTCERDADCRGVKTPSCVKTSCDEGRCTIDKDACECVSSEECDDGDPCTRDLCFSNTNECIHMKQECD